MSIQPVSARVGPIPRVERAETVISVRDVSKRFVIRKDKSLKERLVNFGRSNRHKEDFHALRSVSLDIEAGSTVGLIGPNGSGKSTLLKTIGGIIQPTQGEVLRRGRLAALLELGAGFHPDLTGRENVFLNASILGIAKSETTKHFDEIVDFAGIGEFIDTQVKFYSSGMYVRLAFAVAVHVDPDVLIVDEVLAVGDEPFQRKCMDRIKSLQRAGKTIILVTHSLDQVAELCDRAVVLEHGSIVYDGDPGAAIRTLREGFEETRQEEERAHSVVDSSAAPLVITDSTLSGSDGGADSLGDGKSLVFAVDVSSSLPTGGVLVGMGIETPLGQLVMGTNTELLGLPPIFVDGSARVTFELRDLWLGGGQYFLHASVGTLEQGEMSRVPQAATFSVPMDRSKVGVLDASVSGSVT